VKLLAMKPWQLAAQSKVDLRGVRPMVSVCLICTVLTGAIAWQWILAPPVAFCAVLATLLALGVWACGRRPAEVGSVHDRQLSKS